MKFEYLVYLRDRKTGEIKEILYSFEEDGVYPDDNFDDGTEYMWADGGNYSCDCNRYDFFYPDDDFNCPCVDEGEYANEQGHRFDLLFLINKKTGKVLYPYQDNFYKIGS